MPWNTTMQLGPNAVRVLITDENRNEILKARLPLQSIHPRAVTSLMEGLALWAGHPLTVARSAAERSGRTYAEWLFGAGRWPESSRLVNYDVIEDHRGRRRTIPGVGDFRQLRRLHRDGRSS
jgi:hypothetical protein